MRNRAEFKQLRPKNVLIIPGYGDRVDYLNFFTKNWPEAYRLNPIIQPFGTTRPPEDYDECYERMAETLWGIGRCAAVGVSFGGKIANQLKKEHPDLLGKVVNIATPQSVASLGEELANTKYPMFKFAAARPSLGEWDMDDLMTITGLWDELNKTRDMRVAGARNLIVPAIGHQPSIVAAFALRSQAMAEFMHEDALTG